MTQKTKPVAEIKDKELKIAIWKNHGKNGAFYKTQPPVKTYKDGEEFKETTSMDGSDQLRLAWLHTQAHQKILSLEASDRAAKVETPQDNPEGPQ